MNIRDVIFGRTLANREQEGRKIGWFEAVPAMGLDGLGSASYGPEAALTILIPLGAASLTWVGWVMAPIIGLLIVLYLSYRQTVVAYQTNGGAYTVAKENLGRSTSLSGSRGGRRPDLFSSQSATLDRRAVSGHSRRRHGRQPRGHQ